VADWSVLPGEVELHVFCDHLSDEAAIAERLAGFEVVVGMRDRTPFPRSLLQRLPKLALLVTLGMANRSFDLEGATELGIVVSGTGGSGADPIEMTWALILALVRNIPREDQALREGLWQTALGTRLAGKTLGIVGLGRIGAHVARIGAAFDMSVIAWSQNLTASRAKEHGAILAAKDRLLADSDVITLHLRLGDRTQGLIGAPELAMMKPSAFLVNTARSRLIDEAALIDALRRRRIAGAALDVFDREPLPVDHPLRRMDNTVITPHLGGVTLDRYRTDYDQVIEDIVSHLGGTPLRVLNAEVLARPNLRRLPGRPSR
jgi:phosphoglycerate dehydrogenase-like enzyme